MENSYHLENIIDSSKKFPRTFQRPTEREIQQLKIGDLVRLFFVLDSQSKEKRSAERMWVEIFEINGENYKGYLTNQPYYIHELSLGDIVKFKTENIATVLTDLNINENLKAIISKRALEKRQVNWILREETSREEDSGWQFYFGDEDQDYLDIVENCQIITLKEVLSFEPRIETILGSSHNAFEWNEEENQFVEADF